MPSLLPATEQSPASSVEYNDEICRGDNNNNNPIVGNNSYIAQQQATGTPTSSYDRLNGSSAPLTPMTPSGFVPASTALEQYRLQLYNYALHMERLRCTPQDHSQHQAQQQRQQNYNLPGSVSGSNVYPTTTYAPSNRLALSMSLFPQHIFKPEDPKPQHSYIGLIAMAILSSAELKLVLSDIYQYILDNYPYFRTRGPGWRNSIRHNLSLNDCFVKSGRSANGKGHYWAIHPANMEDFRKGDFRRRKAQRKVRKHMGLTVDDAGTDSPSPPPLDLSSPPPPAVASGLHSSHPPHPFTVAQQLAAFGYLQQQRQQQPLSVIAPPLMGHQYNFRPLAARYYITAAPTASLPYSGVQQRLSSHVGGNALKASSATASVIANLYSQSRKRQFDVASLLAPDVEVAIADEHDAEMQETTTTTTTTTTLDVEGEVAANTTTQLQQTVITKLTLNHQCHLNNHQQQTPTTGTASSENSTADEQNEDIDVVDVDAQSNADSNEEDSQQTDDWRYRNRRHEEISRIEATDETTQENAVGRSNAGSRGNETSKHNSSPRNSPSEIFVSTISAEVATSEQNEHMKPLTDVPEEEIQHTAPCITDFAQEAVSPDEYYPFSNNINDNNNLNHSNSSVDPYVFSRYYGTYMAAAARRLHVGSAYDQ